MRVAISGTHRSGKSTLVEVLSELLPRYALVDEPYHQLEEESYEFAETPTVEDFEAQLARSVADLREARLNALFDRCPVDLLAYWAVHDDGGACDFGAWLPRVRRAMRRLDLV